MISIGTGKFYCGLALFLTVIILIFVYWFDGTLQVEAPYTGGADKTAHMSTLDVGTPGPELGALTAGRLTGVVEVEGVDTDVSVGDTVVDSVRTNMLPFEEVNSTTTDRDRSIENGENRGFDGNYDVTVQLYEGFEPKRKSSVTSGGLIVPKAASRSAVGREGMESEETASVNTEDYVGPRFKVGDTKTSVSNLSLEDAIKLKAPSFKN